MHDHLGGQENDDTLLIEPRTTKVIKLRSTLITELPFTLLKIGGQGDSLTISLMQSLMYNNQDLGKFKSIILGVSVIFNL